MPRTKCILTAPELWDMVRIYSGFEEFVFDVETQGTRPSRDLPGHKGKPKDIPALDALTNEVIWISFAGPGRADVIPLGHPMGGPPQIPREVAFQILEPLFFSDARKIGHNVKFDLLTVSKYYGELPPPPYGDTQTLVHLLNENWGTHGGFNLENLTLRYLHYKYKEKLGIKVTKVDFERAARYSYLDAKNTWLLWHQLKPFCVDKPKLWALFEDVEMPVLAALCEMYKHGVFVDRERFLSLTKEFTIRVREAEDHFYSLAGKTKEEFNLRSAPQRAEFFYHELGIRCDFFTPKGAESVNAEALQKMARKNPIAQALLDYSTLQKVLTTYLKGFIPHIDPDDRIRASYNQSLPVTGRYSCSGPNIQNIGVREKEGFDAKVIRGLFVAPRHHVLIVGDYTQIELMVFAHCAKDPLMLKAYRENLDLHRLTASKVYHIPEDRVNPEQRAHSKNANFNLIYRGGPDKLAKLTGIAVPAAKVIHAGWHQTYPSARRYWEKQIDFCREHGYVETLFGRRRRLPGIISRVDKTRISAENQAVNHPIQGTAADICKTATVQIDQALRERDYPAHLVMQIHDEFVVECPEELADEIVELMRSAMENILLDGKPVLAVPLRADIHVGKSWSEAK